MDLEQLLVTINSMPQAQRLAVIQALNAERPTGPNASPSMDPPARPSLPTHPTPPPPSPSPQVATARKQLSHFIWVSSVLVLVEKILNDDEIFYFFKSANLPRKSIVTVIPTGSIDQLCTLLCQEARKVVMSSIEKEIISDGKTNGQLIDGMKTLFSKVGYVWRVEDEEFFDGAISNEELSKRKFDSGELVQSLEMCVFVDV